jgi:Protein of unknown function (DUF2975)
LFYNNLLLLLGVHAMPLSIASSATPPSHLVAKRSRHVGIGWSFVFLALVLPVAVLFYSLSTALSAQLQAFGLPANLAQAARSGTALHVQWTLLTLLPVAGLSYALWQAGRCSRAFAHSQAFHRDAIEALRRSVWGMAFAAIASLVLPSMLSLLLSWHLMTGPRSLVVSINAQALVLLAFAALVGQMVAVLRQGMQLAEENAQFV